MNPLRRQETDTQILKLLQVLQLIRELEPEKAKVNELPIQTLTVLMYVASHDGCHKQAMEEDLGMNKAAEKDTVVNTDTKEDATTLADEREFPKVYPKRIRTPVVRFEPTWWTYEY